MCGTRQNARRFRRPWATRGFSPSWHDGQAMARASAHVRRHTKAPFQHGQTADSSLDTSYFCVNTCQSYLEFLLLLYRRGECIFKCTHTPRYIQYLYSNACNGVELSWDPPNKTSVLSKNKSKNKFLSINIEWTEHALYPERTCAYHVTNHWLMIGGKLFTNYCLDSNIIYC